MGALIIECVFESSDAGASRALSHNISVLMQFDHPAMEALYEHE